LIGKRGYDATINRRGKIAKSYRQVFKAVCRLAVCRLGRHVV